MVPTSLQAAICAVRIQAIFSPVARGAGLNRLREDDKWPGSSTNGHLALRPTAAARVALNTADQVPTGTVPVASDDSLAGKPNMSGLSLL